MERSQIKAFVPWTKTFRICSVEESVVLEEISRIAHKKEISDSELIRNILSLYVLEHKKQEVAA